MFDNPYLFYGLIFAAALLAADTFLRTLGSIRRSNREVVNRLEELRKSKGVDVGFGELLRLRGLGGRDGEQTLGGLINQYIAQTGREISIFRRFVILFFLFFVGYGLATVVISYAPVFQILSGFIFSVLVSSLMVYVLRQRRILQFTEQLAPAIDIMVRSLSAGHPLTTAISLVSREMPDPIGSEFGILSDQMTFGSEIEQAMLSMCDRVGAPELNMLTVSVSVQRSTGGNLAEILDNLAQMIRDRIMIKSKVKAISAEGRITAWIMLLFPFGLFFMLKTLVPTYFDLVWESGYGEFIVAGCLGLIFAGMIIIRRLVNFDF
ncbi:pilus assembly protein TadB [Sulfitobacter sp. JBTF-M27]|uniref:Pilus assembly protein TadB n=1 Tax=Sulfitobacter sediminilitoris TaxID=2698830 RepID=A0A6P0CI10_9RHOB|nr:type II secretion system F family protein [Sulfitobacter sediminilitoris]NEK24726.1 pilus assembly protein TadB [Sulfitobacter sediminilitoris]